jgi:signal recognition particle subunit SRP54
LDALEPFHPDRMASRILGMGDVLTLVEDAQRSVDAHAAQKLAAKLKKGKEFDLEDFKDQLQQMKKMGGAHALLERLPTQLSKMATGAQFDDKSIARVVGIIHAMTPPERAKPDILKASRKRRIAAGAGVSVQEVNRLLAQFEQMQKMMKMLSKGGMTKMMRGLKGMFPGMR